MKSFRQFNEGRHFDLLSRRWDIDAVDRYVARKKLKPTSTINPKIWIDSEWGHIIPVDHEFIASDKVDLSKPIYVAKILDPSTQKYMHIPIDGWHRLHKAAQKGITSLPVIMIDGDDPQFY